ncbi:sunset domain-containing protein [Companilactobacillus hulinensis]|uniref:sunset domain-containing protein n=1 Tax=Companilactobacillus hulinensis TaxID=2486007 RepID=UPI000F797EA4|nr:DNA-entry nuclease [Companilactobacillus hulinensis]
MHSFSRRFKFILASLIIVMSFVAVSFATDLDNVGVNVIQAAQRIKYIGKDKYEIAQKEHKALLAKKKKLTKQANKTSDQVDDIKTQEEKAKKEAAKQQAAAEKQQKEQEAQQQKQAAATQRAQEEQAQQQQIATNSSTGSRGDMNTASTGQIVGNKNSHIYHVPGQRGYNMNSSNAVYFQTEQEAINAGYRKAKV